MPAKTPAPADPDLSMTEQEVAAILGDAQADAEQAARDLAAAEALLRGEAPPAAAMRAEEITPARLAELRAAAEFAALKVPAAERRTEAIREKRKLAGWEAVRAQIRGEAAADLDQAEHLVAALDTFETALRGLCEAFQGHNDRLARWARMMGSAGTRAHGEQAGPEGFAYDPRGAHLTIGRKVYRPFVGAQYIGATLHRVLRDYPRDFRQYDGAELAGRDWHSFTPTPEPDGPIDMRKQIRRDA